MLKDKQQQELLAFLIVLQLITQDSLIRIILWHQLI
jgi:hypothetical protein